MSDKKTFVDFESKKRDNIFDNYLTKIESLKLELIKSIKEDKDKDKDKDTKLLHQVELAIVILERTFQDFITDRANSISKNKIMNNKLTAILTKWYPIFEKLASHERFLEPFIYHLIGLEATSKEVVNLSEGRIESCLNFFYPSKNNKRQYNEEKKIVQNQLSETKDYLASIGASFLKGGINASDSNYYNIVFGSRYGVVKESKVALILAGSILKNYKKAIFGNLQINELHKETNIEQFRSENKVNNIIQIIESVNDNNEIERFEWDVEIKFLGKELEASQVFYFNWAFSEGLSKIDGVKLLIEDWGKGSLWTRIKAIFNDETSKEEAKQILQKSRDALEAQYLDKPKEEVEKLRKEKEKIGRETEILMDKDEAKEFRQIDKENRILNIEEKKLNIESKHLDNQLKKLEILKGISEIVTGGLISIDSDYQISINEILTIEKKDGVYLNHNSLELVEENETLKLKEIEADEADEGEGRNEA